MGMDIIDLGPRSVGLDPGVFVRQDVMTSPA
jgi:hypothetical protein